MEPTDLETKQLFDDLEARGEDAVRIDLRKGVWDAKQIPLVKEWLAQKERNRETSQAEELVEQARDANRIAAQANRISRWSAAAAVGAFILSAIALLVALGVL